MNQPTRNGSSNESGTSQAEDTLRLIARVPVPTGLEDRVHIRMRNAPARARILPWPVSSGSSAGWLRGTAAAAIVLVVAGGSWGIYSRVAPDHTMKGISGPRIAGPGEFSQGGAVRRPQTLQGPVVVPTQTPVVAHPATAVKPKTKPAAMASTAKPGSVASVPLAR